MVQHALSRLLVGFWWDGDKWAIVRFAHAFLSTEWWPRAWFPTRLAPIFQYSYFWATPRGLRGGICWNPRSRMTQCCVSHGLIVLPTTWAS